MPLTRGRHGLGVHRVPPRPGPLISWTDRDLVVAGDIQQQDHRAPAIIARAEQLPASRLPDLRHEADAALIDRHQHGGARRHHDPPGVRLSGLDRLLLGLLTERQGLFRPGRLGRQGRGEEKGQSESRKPEGGAAPERQRAGRHASNFTAFYRIWPPRSDNCDYIPGCP